MAEIYSERERAVLERHIKKYFGSWSRVLHGAPVQASSPDIQLDIFVIEPDPERDFYTLVTVGMGARRMNIPAELATLRLERAELLLSLPPEWEPEQAEKGRQWPLYLLERLAGLPAEKDVWFELGWTVLDSEESLFAPSSENDAPTADTGFAGAMLLPPGSFPGDASSCLLPDGEEVNFFSVAPLYREELEYMDRFGVMALLNRFKRYLGEICLSAADCSRRNICEGEDFPDAEEKSDRGTEPADGATLSGAGTKHENGAALSGGEKKTLLGRRDIEALESFQGEISGYFERMIEYLNHFMEEGIVSGRFTEEEARADLEIALWYSYACNNVDDYEHYYMAAQWMPDSEKNAGGCGAWYYRYSCALMYCGRLQEALKYAEKGVVQEPDYPWGWLQLAKLRSHFGEKDGALAAVEKGLSLEPGDYEFLTLQREIEENRSLAEMEYHYIDPDSDEKLQNGLLEESDGKLKAIAGIVCDEAALAGIKELFNPISWEADSPYCVFRFELEGRQLEGVFCMNEAALSGMNPDWLRDQKEKLAQGHYFIQKRGENVYELQAVVFGRDYSTELVYYDSRTQQSFQICVRRDGIEADLPEPFLMNLALAEVERDVLSRLSDGTGAAEFEGEEAAGDEEEHEILLYRSEGGVTRYAALSAEGTEVTERTGTVGERGRTEIHDCGSPKDAAAFAQELQRWYSSQGYRVWEREDDSWIVVRFPVRPEAFDEVSAVLSDEEAARRDRIAWLLNNELMETGLGRADGWEIGRCLDENDVFSLDIYCTVAEADAGVRIIRQALESEGDLGKFEIAVIEPGQADYRLVYPVAGEKDDR